MRLPAAKANQRSQQIAANSADPNENGRQESVPTLPEAAARMASQETRSDWQTAAATESATDHHQVLAHRSAGLEAGANDRA